MSDSEQDPATKLQINHGDVMEKWKGRSSAPSPRCNRLLVLMTFLQHRAVTEKKRRNSTARRRGFLNRYKTRFRHRNISRSIQRHRRRRGTGLPNTALYEDLFTHPSVIVGGHRNWDKLVTMMTEENINSEKRLSSETSSKSRWTT